MKLAVLILGGLFWGSFPLFAQGGELLKVGSKRFTENYILAEIVARLAEREAGLSIERRLGLGGTGITYGALIEGEIDLYPEYTGTISEAIIKNSRLREREELQEKLSGMGLGISPSLGFNNTYALAMRSERAEQLGIERVSDLIDYPELVLGLSHEFIRREDGLPGLQEHYQINFQNVQAMEHSLSYDAISGNRIDIIVVYSTDAKIQSFNLKVLKDDLEFFPRYESVLLHDLNLPERHPALWEALERYLFGKIDEPTMIRLNSLAEEDRWSFSNVAAYYLNDDFIVRDSIPWTSIGELTVQHLKLVGVSLVIATVIGVPLGIFAFHYHLLAQLVLIGSGLLQTIPSLALLCFLIPFVGIGEVPAYIALFLYGLLPIVRNTYTGLKQIPLGHLESAKMMGMTSLQKLRIVLLPQASPLIFAGIKTSGVINVGTATLAAFVGAGGLGHLIVTGLSLNDNKTILYGAVPSAALAVILHLIFEGTDRLFIPRGIRN